MTTLGERIKVVRKENKLTQQEFSKKLRLSRPSISEIEHNKYTASKQTVLLISILFNVDEEWLLIGNL